MSTGGFQNPLSRVFGILDQSDPTTPDSYGSPQIPNAPGANPLANVFGILDATDDPMSPPPAMPAAPAEMPSAAPQMAMPSEIPGIDEAAANRRAMIEKFAAEGVSGSIPDGDYLRDQKGALLLDPFTKQPQQKRIMLTPEERLHAAKTYYQSKIGQGNVGGVEGALWYVKGAPAIGGIATAADIARTVAANKAIERDIANGTNTATDEDYLQVGRAIAANEEAQRPQGFMQRVGEGVYGSASMAADMLLSGGVAAAGKKVAAKTAKEIGQAIAEKTASRTMGGLARRGIMAAEGEAFRLAAPNMAARAVANSMQRGTDKLNTTDDGAIGAAKQDGESAFSAIMKGFGEQYAEQLGETSGAGMKHVAKILSKTKIAQSLADTAIGKAASKAAGAMSNKAVSRVLRGAELDGFLPEMIEEFNTELLKTPIIGPNGVTGLLSQGRYEDAAKELGVMAATVGVTMGGAKAAGSAISATGNAIQQHNLDQREGQLRTEMAGGDLRQRQSPVTGNFSLKRIVDAAPQEVAAFTASAEPSRSAMESSGLRAKLRELDLYDHASNADGRRQLWERLKQFTAAPEDAAQAVPNRMHSAMERYGSSPLTPVERATSNVTLDEQGWPVLAFEVSSWPQGDRTLAIRQRQAGWTLELPGGKHQPFTRFDQAMDAARGALGGKTLDINRPYVESVKSYMELFSKAKRSGMKGPPVPQELKMPTVDAVEWPESELPLPEQETAPADAIGVPSPPVETTPAPASRRPAPVRIENGTPEEHAEFFGKTPTPVTALSERQQQAQRNLEAFGAKVRWFHDHDDSPAISSRRLGVVYLNAAHMTDDVDTAAFSQVIGDEVAHVSGVDAMTDLLSAKELQRRRESYLAQAPAGHKARLLADSGLLDREAVADYVAEFWRSNSFRAELFNENPSLWNRIVDAVLRLFGRNSSRYARLPESQRKVIDALRAKMTGPAIASRTPATSTTNRVPQSQSQPTAAGSQENLPDSKPASPPKSPSRPSEGKRLTPPSIERIEDDPVVRMHYDAPAGVSEGYTVGEHSLEVLRNFDEQADREAIDAIGQKYDIRAYDTIRAAVALHDIGKGRAVKEGNKSLQHRYTLPILRDVMNRRGFTQKEIDVAAAIVGNDAIGLAIQGKLAPQKAAEVIRAASAKAGMSPQDYFDLQSMYYKSDAASYPSLRSSLFATQGDKLKIAKEPYGILEELIHGQVRETPWVGRGGANGRVEPVGGGGNRGAGEFVHGTAIKFDRFSEEFDSGKNRVGPGAYLLDEKDADVAEHYSARAYKRLLSLFTPKTRATLENADAAKLESLAEMARQRSEAARLDGDEKNAGRWAQAEQIVSAMRDGRLGKHVLSAEFSPKKILDMGADESGGRLLTEQEASVIRGAAPDAAMPDTRRAFALYDAAAAAVGKARVNEAIKAAGYDAIHFVHKKGGYSRPYSVFTALSHSDAVPVASRKARRGISRNVEEQPEPTTPASVVEQPQAKEQSDAPRQEEGREGRAGLLAPTAEKQAELPPAPTPGDAGGGEAAPQSTGRKVTNPKVGDRVTYVDLRDDQRKSGTITRVTISGRIWIDEGRDPLLKSANPMFLDLEYAEQPPVRGVSKPPEQPPVAVEPPVEPPVVRGVDKAGDNARPEKSPRTPPAKVSTQGQYAIPGMESEAIASEREKERRREFSREGQEIADKVQGDPEQFGRWMADMDEAIASVMSRESPGSFEDWPDRIAKVFGVIPETKPGLTLRQSRQREQDRDEWATEWTLERIGKRLKDAKEYGLFKVGEDASYEDYAGDRRNGRVTGFYLDGWEATADITGRQGQVTHAPVSSLRDADKEYDPVTTEVAQPSREPESWEISGGEYASKVYDTLGIDAQREVVRRSSGAKKEGARKHLETLLEMHRQSRETHRDIVAKAVNEGKPVPQSVRDEYDKPASSPAIPEDATTQESTPVLHGFAKEQFDGYLPILKQQVLAENSARRQASIAASILSGLNPDAIRALVNEMKSFAPAAYRYGHVNRTTIMEVGLRQFFADAPDAAPGSLDELRVKMASELAEVESELDKKTQALSRRKAEAMRSRSRNKKSLVDQLESEHSANKESADKQKQDIYARYRPLIQSHPEFKAQSDADRASLEEKNVAAVSRVIPSVELPEWERARTTQAGMTDVYRDEDNRLNKEYEEAETEANKALALYNNNYAKAKQELNEKRRARYEKLAGIASDLREKSTAARDRRMTALLEDYAEQADNPTRAIAARYELVRTGEKGSSEQRHNARVEMESLAKAMDRLVRSSLPAAAAKETDFDGKLPEELAEPINDRAVADVVNRALGSPLSDTDVVERLRGSLRGERLNEAKRIARREVESLDMKGEGSRFLQRIDQSYDWSSIEATVEAAKEHKIQVDSADAARQQQMEYERQANAEARKKFNESLMTDFSGVKATAARALSTRIPTEGGVAITDARWLVLTDEMPEKAKAELLKRPIGGRYSEDNPLRKKTVEDTLSGVGKGEFLDATLLAVVPEETTFDRKGKPEKSDPTAIYETEGGMLRAFNAYPLAFLTDRGVIDRVTVSAERDAAKLWKGRKLVGVMVGYESDKSPDIARLDVESIKARRGQEDTSHQKKRRGKQKKAAEDSSRGMSVSTTLTPRHAISTTEDAATDTANAESILKPQVPAKWAAGTPKGDYAKKLAAKMDEEATDPTPSIGPAHIMRFLGDRLHASLHYVNSQLPGRRGVFKRINAVIFGRSPWEAAVTIHELGHALSRMTADKSGISANVTEWHATELAAHSLAKDGITKPSKKQIKDRASELGDLLLQLTDPELTPDGVSMASAATTEEGMGEFVRRYVMRHDTLDSFGELRPTIESYLETKAPDVLEALQDAHRLWVKLEARPTGDRAALAVTERLPPPETSARVSQVARKAAVAIVGPSAGEKMRGITLYNATKKGAEKAGVNDPVSVARAVRQRFGYDTARGYSGRMDAAFGVWAQAQSLVPSEEKYALTTHIRVALQKKATPFRVVPDSKDDWSADDRRAASSTGVITESQLARFEKLGVYVPLEAVKPGDYVKLSQHGLREMFDDLKQKGTYDKFDGYRALRTSLYRHKQAADKADLDWSSDLAAVQRLHPYPGIDTLLKPTDVEAWLRETERQHPYVEGGSPGFRNHYDTQQQFLRQLLMIDILSGERSAEEVLKMMEAHTEYSHIPRRILNDHDLDGFSAAVSGGLDISSGVKRARGSELPYLPMIEAMVRRASNALSSYYEMATIRAGLAMMDELDKPINVDGKQVMLDYGLRKFLQRQMVKVAPDPVVVATLLKSDAAVQKIQEYMAQKIGEALGEDINPAELDLDLDDFSPTPVMRVKRPKMPNVLGYFDPAEPGVRKYVFVPDPATWMTLTYLGGVDSNWLSAVSKLARAADEPMRKHVTNTLGFVFNNFIRDPMSFAMFSESVKEGLTPMIAAVAAFRRAMKPKLGMTGVMKGDMTEAWEDAAVIGKMLTNDITPDTTTAKGRFVEHAFGSWSKWSADDPVLRRFAIVTKNLSQAGLQGPLLFSGLMAASGIPIAGESLHRVGAKVLAKERGASDLEAQLAFAKATGFFAQRGASKTARDITAGAMFLNPAMQGAWQGMENLLELGGDPQKAALLALKTTILFGAGAAAAYIAAGLLEIMPGSDEEKRQLLINANERSESDRLRRAWFPVYTPWGGTELVASKAGGGPLGVAFHYGFDTAMSKMTEGGRPVGLGARAKRVWEEIPYGTPYDVIPRTANIMRQFVANYEDFRDQPIEPDWMRREYPDHPEFRTTDRDPGLTKLVSESLAATGLPAMVRPSPVRLRFLAEQAGGSDSIILMEWADYLSGKTKQRPRIPLASGLLLGDYTGRYGQSARDVYDDAQKAESARNAAYLAIEKQQDPTPYWLELKELGGALAAQAVIEDKWKRVTAEMGKPNSDEEEIRRLKLNITETAIDYRLNPEKWRKAFIAGELAKQAKYPTWRASDERREKMRIERERLQSKQRALKAP